MVASHGATDIPQALPVTLSTEAGHIGGIPAGGRQFGAAHNAEAHIPTASMIDLYQGGGVDVAFLGMAEVSLACDGLFKTLPVILMAFPPS